MLPTGAVCAILHQSESWSTLAVVSDMGEYAIMCTAAVMVAT